MRVPVLQYSLKIVGARNLPKTDTFGKTDAYVKMYVASTRVLCGRTKVIDDTLNPNWNETHNCITTPDDSILLELWDQDPASSEKFGSCSVAIASLPSDGRTTEVKIDIDDHKLRKKYPDAFIMVALEGYIKPYETVKEELQRYSVPGCVFNDSKRYLYVPASQLGQGVYIKVEYEKKGIDVKLLNVLNTKGQRAFDIGWVQAKNTKIRHRTWHHGEHMDGLVVYEELKLDDLPLRADFSQVLLMCFDAQVTHTAGLDQVATAHGWKGALGYRSAKSVLHGCNWDDKEEEIFMTIPNVDPFVQVIVDFDADNVDMKAGMFEGGNIGHVACDLTIVGQDCKKTTNIFNPAKSVCGGRFRMARQVELDDVKFGTSLRDMQFIMLALSNPRQVPLSSIISLR